MDEESFLKMLRGIYADADNFRRAVAHYILALPASGRSEREDLLYEQLWRARLETEILLERIRRT